MKILIVCDGKRGSDLARAFSSEECYIISQQETKKVGDGGWNSNDDSLPKIDFLFVHVGDLEGRGGLRIPENVEPLAAFYFSSGEQPDYSYPYRNSHAIFPPVKAGASPFSESVVQEFQAYWRSGCARSYLPSVCRPVHLFLVPTLLILCQGYMAVHAELGLDLDLIKDCLTAMKWHNIPGDHVPRDIGPKLSAVRSPAWWLVPLSPLTDSDEFRSAIDAVDQRALIERFLRRELRLPFGTGMPPPIGNLLDVLSPENPQKGVEVEAGTVASAFLYLKDYC